jgi:tellurite methyltransferase
MPAGESERRRQVPLGVKLNLVRIADWDERYRAGARGTEQDPARLVARYGASEKPGRALDLACGTGSNAIYLAQLGWQVTAVDGSAAAIEILSRRASEKQVAVNAVVADLERGEFRIEPGSWDLILSCYFLERDLFPQIHAGVRLGGLAIAIVHTPDTGELPDQKRAAVGELRGLFPGWEILHDYEGPPQDSGHKRLVSEIVARRSVAAADGPGRGPAG